MPRVVVKGGVWKNVRRSRARNRPLTLQTEDEILKAAVSKYGMNVRAPTGEPPADPPAMGTNLVAARAQDAEAVQGSLVRVAGPVDQEDRVVQGGG